MHAVFAESVAAVTEVGFYLGVARHFFAAMARRREVVLLRYDLVERLVPLRLCVSAANYLVLVIRISTLLFIWRCSSLSFATFGLVSP